MKNEYLKTGAIITLRNGNEYTLRNGLAGLFYYKKTKCCQVHYYLKFNYDGLNSRKDKQFDIIKIK